MLDLQIANRSPRTIEVNIYKLKRLAGWCHDRGIETITDLTAEALQGYRRNLFHHRDAKTGKPLQPSTQAQHLITIRTFCRWLLENEVMDNDPSRDLPLPTLPRRSLSEVLTLEEVNALLAQPHISKPMGIRNRAILETFYSTAMRASELSNLSLFDIDHDRKLVRIRHGKGNKDRLTPICTSDLGWINKYIADVRPRNVRKNSGNSLFVGQRGGNVSRFRLAQLVHEAMQSAGIQKSGDCHLLRHTAATLMLENGADLRSLQTYLGHERLDTTHLSPDHLREVHEKTHPTGDKHKPKDNKDSTDDGKPDHDANPNRSSHTGEW